MVTKDLFCSIDGLPEKKKELRPEGYILQHEKKLSQVGGL
jgi:hypothetical protein